MNNNNPGLAEQRFQRIRSFLKQRDVVSVDELCRELGVSAATVRRDLAELDARGQVRRVHGGAVNAETRLDENVFDDKTLIATEQKNQIAAEALKLIDPKDSIYLDGGSTTMALARMLLDMSKLTVVTNSLRVATTLSSAGPRLIVVGGEFRRISQTIVGSMSRSILEDLYINKAFMGTMGLREGVMTTTDPAEALTKETVISRAKQIIVLADSSKCGVDSFVRFGVLSSGMTLITDDGVSISDRTNFVKKGIKVITGQQTKETE